jgi:hypothetical protein
LSLMWMYLGTKKHPNTSTLEKVIVIGGSIIISFKNLFFFRPCSHLNSCYFNNL